MITPEHKQNGQKKEKETLRQTYAELGPLLGIGIQLAATMLLMVFLGKWLDEKFDKQPLFLIICSVFGMVAGLYNLINTVSKYDKKKQK